MNSSKSQILEFARSNNTVCADSIKMAFGMQLSTARQYLSSLAKENELLRVGKGVYIIADKQRFCYTPSETAKNIYFQLKHQLPYTDFCVYDGNILASLQHHLSINNSIYVETNRDAVESVFAQLKDQYPKVYRQPSAAFMYDYIDLKEECIIVKTLVTESPLMEINGMKVPTIEKLLVDTQKDADFDYLRGSESYNMFQMAFDLYSINTQKMMRYAKRRNVTKEITEITNLTK